MCAIAAGSVAIGVVLGVVLGHVVILLGAVELHASRIQARWHALKGAELAGLKWPSWRDKRSLTLILDMVSYSAN